MTSIYRKEIVKRIIRTIAGLALAAIICLIAIPVEAQAKVYLLPDGTQFDSDFYANMYPEMRSAYANGKYPERLLWHYLTYGIKEGRLPSMYSTYNPSPAVMSTPYIYPAGNFYVVPYQTLYPYTPYVIPTTIGQNIYPGGALSYSYTQIPTNVGSYAYMCIPYTY